MHCRIGWPSHALCLRSCAPLLSLRPLGSAQVVELMKRQPAVPETGTLVPSSFAGKITL